MTLARNLLLLLSVLGSWGLATSESKCLDVCTCEWASSVLFLTCQGLKGNKIPSFQGLLVGSRHVNLKLDNRDLLRLFKYNFPTNFYLSQANIKGSTRIVYADDTFKNSEYSLEQLSLNAGRYRFDKVFAPVSCLGNLLYLTITCLRQPAPLTYIGKVLFSGKLEHSLQALTLDSCGIKYFHPIAVSKLSRLTSLSLPGNYLTGIPSRLSENLDYLRLDFNQITSFRQRDLPVHLKSVVLSHNKLKSVPRGAFMNFRYLRNLDLSYNTELSQLNNVFDTRYLDHRPNLDLTSTGMTGFNFLNTFGMSRISFTASGPKLRCDCYLKKFFAKKQGIARGSCLANDDLQLMIPSEVLEDYLAQMECPCRSHDGRRCLPSSALTGEVNVCALTYHQRGYVTCLLPGLIIAWML